MIAVVIGATIFYLTLSVPLAIVLVPCLVAGGAMFITNPVSVPLSIGVFLAAWAAQFWGHKVEGKKPSFLKDILFLLVGPLWIMNQIFEIFEIPAQKSP